MTVLLVTNLTGLGDERVILASSYSTVTPTHESSN